MELDQAWTVAIGSPIKLKNGHFGKVIQVDLQNEVFKIEEYNDNYIVREVDIHYRDVKSLTSNPLYDTKRQALVEL